MKKQSEENLPDKFAEFDRSFRHVANSDHAGQVPQQGYVREVQDATARGRAQMAAARRGERSFPPARQVVKP